MTNDELVNLRGIVASKFQGIERNIGVLISHYYLGKTSFDFVQNVMGNEFSSFAFKRGVFMHICKLLEKSGKEIDSLIKDLNRASQLRNIFVHGTGKFVKNKEVNFIDSKDPSGNSVINPQPIYEEFIGLHRKIFDYTIQMGKEMGTPLISDKYFSFERDI